MTTQAEVLALLDRLQPTAAFEPFASRHHDVRPLAAGVDQTNTSWVIDESVIVKKYREVQPGEHPEVRAGLALPASQECHRLSDGSRVRRESKPSPIASSPDRSDVGRRPSNRRSSLRERPRRAAGQ